MTAKLQEQEAWDEWIHSNNPGFNRHGIRAAYKAGFEAGRKSVAPQDAEKVGLPPTPFFYTVDQVATLLGLQRRSVEARILFYQGRSVGIPPKGKLIATNMMPEGETPEWRILDKHLIQFLRFKNIRFQSMGYR